MRAIVTGGAGFIGGHLVKFLKSKHYWVRAIDIKAPLFGKTLADDLVIQDLRHPCPGLFQNIDEVYHLAADMGGVGYIEAHKAEIVFNNTMINMLTLKACEEAKVKKFLFASSACVYPGYKQGKFHSDGLVEADAYPADAEDGYGWEKLMMERACRHFREDFGLSTYVARFHNIYGPLGAYEGGREKSPAALCRKVALARGQDAIEIWGDGKQIRSYCYVDDCVEALYRLMQSEYHEPINIGTDRAVTIGELADIIIRISGKKIAKYYNLNAPQGVYARNADITKAWDILKWGPQISLEEGLQKTYEWISLELKKK